MSILVMGVMEFKDGLICNCERLFWYEGLWRRNIENTWI